MRFSRILGIVILALLGCDSEEGETDGANGDGDSCDVSAPTACPSDMPTYEDVQPIFEERCVVCHSGGDGGECPTCWGLDSYTDIKHWTQEIRSVMLQCTMPPPESGKTMTDAERMEILEWLRCGAPE